MRLSRLGTDTSPQHNYQGFRGRVRVGRIDPRAGQPSSCRPTNRGCGAAIQEAAARRQIRRRDQGYSVGDESASRNRKFESTSLQRIDDCELGNRAPPRRSSRPFAAWFSGRAARALGWREAKKATVADRFGLHGALLG
jgi:hypothetical protein